MGAIEAIPRIVPLVERAARRDAYGCRAYGTRAGRRRLLLRRTPTPTSARSPTSTRRPCWLLFAERGGDPDRAGQEAPAGRPAVAGRPRGRAQLGRRLARPWPARLAHRVHRHRPGPPRHGVRRPGRRLRPRLPAPRDGRLHAQALTGECPFARGLRPRRHGRARRGEDEQVPGQPRASSPSCGRTGWTRRDPARRCSPTTTATTGSGPTRVWPRRPSRLARWRAAVSLPAGARRHAPCSGRSARGWPTTWTRRARWPPSTAGWVRPWTPAAAARTPTRRRPLSCRDAVDALLGVAL